MSRLCRNPVCFKWNSDLPGVDEKHPGFTKRKHSFYKEMIVCLPSRVLSSHSVYHPVRFLIPSRFSFKQPLGRPERYQNIQDNPEYYSVLQFRIILKIFAVNILLSRSLSNIYDETFEKILFNR